MIEYLKGAIASFDDCPADTPYERGYLAALKDALLVAEAEETKK